MRRREFIAGLGEAAVWPLAAGAQQSERVRRIGVLLPAAADDPEYQVRVGALQQELALLGWAIGRNVRIDTRWAAGDSDRLRRYATELVALAPDVILGSSSLAVAALQQDYGFSTIFPIALRCSISSWARRASANGMRAAMAGRTLPLPINSTARAMASRRGSSM